ncbi:MAG: PAS domain S-box protein [Sneathiella sp.]
MTVGEDTSIVGGRNKQPIRSVPISQFNEAGLHFLVENSSNFVVLTDVQGRINYANIFAQKLLGDTGQNCLGHSLGKFTSAETTKKISAIVNNLVASPDIPQRELIKFTDSNNLDTLLNVSAYNLLKIEDIGGLLFDGRNITGQDKIEADLRISRDLFESAFSANNSMCSISEFKTGEFVDVNQSWADTLGHTREEAIGHTSVELNIWSDTAMRQGIISKLKEDRRLKGYVAEISCKTGARLTVEINAEILKVGNLERLYFASTDITERVKNAKVLSESEARFRDLLEYSTDWFWETDDNFVFTIVSESANLFEGFDRNRMIGKSVGETFSYFGLVEKSEKIVTIMRDRQPFRGIRYSFKAPDGKIRHQSYNGKPIFDEAGIFLGYRGTGTDETATYEAEARKEIAEEQLRQSQKMEAIGQLTGGIAHDFNNLLSVIIGNAELIDHNLTVDDENRKQLEAIFRAAMNGAELTQSLLAYSRKQVLRPKNIKIDQQLQQLIDVLPRTLDANIDIKVIRPDDLWSCLADPGQVENVLLNLANNASDAMINGGNLSISFANVMLDNEDVGNPPKQVSGYFVKMSVSDSGSGMPKTTLEHIFEPFFTTKDTGKGTGLGLSMVYGFAEQSNGYVSVTSEIKVGTIVDLYLPRSFDGTKE